MVYSLFPPNDGVHGLLLILAMEDAAYLRDRGRRGVQRVLQREEERRSSPLIIFYLSINYILYSSSSILRVGHLLHCKEERMSTLPTPSCASSPPHNGAPSSSILHVGCILDHDDEEYTAYISAS